MLGIAFKEWAVVCKALAIGRQSLILRKGGIAEVGDEFRPEHSRFWLYPTYLHAHRSGIKPEYLSLFDEAIEERPDFGIVRLSHFAEVTRIDYLTNWSHVEKLHQRHIWTSDTVRKKFEYRSPGIFAMYLSIFRVRTPVEVVEQADYAGCKSWIKFDWEYSIENAIDVEKERQASEKEFKRWVEDCSAESNP